MAATADQIGMPIVPYVPQNLSYRASVISRDEACVARERAARLLVIIATRICMDVLANT